ncbi:tetratricopeptide repeat protein [Arcobacter vandammei]|uniref:tetratricopeptide repeat protein n=1 Tax=Arcobacter vandammei TaxID=2782243 RepID=UPI0018E01603|nr:tetratricopeptide repeat protein [Arcobacter vandammei]
MRTIFLFLIIFQILYSNNNLDLYDGKEELFLDVTNDGLKDKISFIYKNIHTNNHLTIERQEKNGSFETIVNKNYLLKENILDKYTFNSMSIEVDKFNTILNWDSETNFTIDYKDTNSLIVILSKEGLLHRYKLYFEYNKKTNKFNLDRVYFLSFGGYDHTLKAVYLIQSDKIKDITLDNFNTGEIHQYLFDNIFRLKELKAKKIKSKEIEDLYKKVEENPKENAEYLLDCSEMENYNDRDCGISENFLFEDDIEFSSNIASFLIEAKIYKEVIPLLEEIIKQEPNRTIAYLNLADAYLEMSKENEKNENYKVAVEYYKNLSKENYEKYIELMKQDNKEEKIPKRVLEFQGN